MLNEANRYLLYWDFRNLPVLCRENGKLPCLGDLGTYSTVPYPGQALSPIQLAIANHFIKAK